MKKSTYIYTGIIIIFFAVFCVINFCGFERFCDSDMYQDIYVSKLIWNSKSIFPPNWTFSNQYFVLAAPNIAAVIYGITGSMNLSMELATTIYTLLILAAFVYMIKAVSSNKTVILVSIICFMAAVTGYDIVNTHQGQLYFLMVSYYASYIFTVFFVYGVYLRYLFASKMEGYTSKDSSSNNSKPKHNTSNEVKTKQYKLKDAALNDSISGNGFNFGVNHPGIFVYIIAIIFTIATGMQSLRQTAIMILPLACVEGIRFFYKVFSKSYTKKDWAVTWKMATLAIINIIAYLMVAVVIKPSHCVLYGGTGIRSISTWGHGFVKSAGNLAKITGIQSLWGAKNYKQNIVLGLIAVMVICVVIYAVVSAIKTVFKETKGKTKGDVKEQTNIRSNIEKNDNANNECNVAKERYIQPIHVLIILFFLGILSIGAMGTLMDIKIRDIYFFMWYPLVATSLTYLLIGKSTIGANADIQNQSDEAINKNNASDAANKYVELAIVILMSIAFIISYGSSAIKALNTTKTQDQLTCQFLEENNIHYLYGHWNTVPEIAVFSDGSITPGGWYTTVYDPIDYLNPKGIYDDKFNGEAAYLILPEEKSEALKIAKDRGITLNQIYSTPAYTIYTADGQLMEQ